MESPCDEVHPDLLMEVLQLDTKSKTFSGTLTLANQLGWMIIISARILKECAEEL